MNIKLNFRISIEVSRRQWETSDMFDTYDKAQAWRRRREAELLRDNPSRMYINSNLIVTRVIA